VGKTNSFFQSGMGSDLTYLRLPGGFAYLATGDTQFIRPGEATAVGKVEKNSIQKIIFPLVKKCSYVQ